MSKKLNPNSLFDLCIIDRIWVPQVISITLLLSSFWRNEYGFFIALKVSCCITFIYILLNIKKFSDVAEEKKVAKSFLFIGIILYLPGVHWGISRDIWQLINVATILGLIFSYLYQNPTQGIYEGED
jgi:hypothetical protein